MVPSCAAAILSLCGMLSLIFFVEDLRGGEAQDSFEDLEFDRRLVPPLHERHEVLIMNETHSGTADLTGTNHGRDVNVELFF